MKTIKIKSGAWAATDEWMIKEEGSWEDHDCIDHHPHAIIKREMNSDIWTITLAEAELLLTSAKHQLHWGDNEYLNEVKYCIVIRGYINRLTKAIKNVTT